MLGWQPVSIDLLADIDEVTGGGTPDVLSERLAWRWAASRIARRLASGVIAGLGTAGARQAGMDPRMLLGGRPWPCLAPWGDHATVSAAISAYESADGPDGIDAVFTQQMRAGGFDPDRFGHGSDPVVDRDSLVEAIRGQLSLWTEVLASDDDHMIELGEGQQAPVGVLKRRWVSSRLRLAAGAGWQARRYGAADILTIAGVDPVRALPDTLDRHLPPVDVARLGAGMAHLSGRLPVAHDTVALTEAVEHCRMAGHGLLETV